MAKKDIFHSTKSCGAKYEIGYTGDNLPYLCCTGCGHVVQDWIKWQREYCDYWKEEEYWKADYKQHHLTCILGYFCHRFEQHYDLEFALSLNESGLFRGAEMNILRRVYNQLGNSALGCKKYIDWYFAEKIQRRKKRITSLSFLATPGMLNEFKLAYKKRKQVTRDKPISLGMRKWLNDFAPEVLDYVNLNDYGDLRLLLTHYKSGHLNDVEHVRKFVEELGYQKIVNEELEIRNWRDSL
jgi:hypothetical protein